VYADLKKTFYAGNLVVDVSMWFLSKMFLDAKICNISTIVCQSHLFNLLKFHTSFNNNLRTVVMCHESKHQQHYTAVKRFLNVKALRVADEVVSRSFEDYRQCWAARIATFNANSVSKSKVSFAENAKAGDDQRKAAEDKKALDDETAKKTAEANQAKKAEEDAKAKKSQDDKAKADAGQKAAEAKNKQNAAAADGAGWNEAVNKKKAPVTKESVLAKVVGDSVGAKSLRTKVEMALARGTDPRVVKKALESNGEYCVLGKHGCQLETCSRQHKFNPAVPRQQKLVQQTTNQVMAALEEQKKLEQKKEEAEKRKQESEQKKLQKEMEVAQQKAQINSLAQTVNDLAQRVSGAAPAMGAWARPLQPSKPPIAADVSLPTAAAPISSLSPPTASSNDNFALFQQFLQFMKQCGHAQ